MVCYIEVDVERRQLFSYHGEVHVAMVGGFVVLDFAGGSSGLSGCGQGLQLAFYPKCGPVTTCHAKCTEIILLCCAVC